ncbi:Golgi-associated plant pathogenesis-related protein 1 [Biomphalaria pfeifferi]|uniref:Golgi-associated plant pathogenesis-related protein 1 n=1 Tax=Biomphalaria pfeifferi TaxID=112525 RepID=A0AAD8C5D4_BIOPF|nr:Golgi-associated plant pathogenesis-related protein 1 [Biomphalaria pfeifferi]
MSFFALLDYLQNGLPPVWKPGIISYQEFADDVVRIHNDYRKKHRAYALRLNDDLCAMTQQWADKLAVSEDLAHSENKYKGSRVGENIAMKWASNKAIYKPQEVCDTWYSEVRKFNFGAEPTGPIETAGHFTQMVWRNSTEIGVGRSQARDGRSIVVVSYFPPGNVAGQFQSNVLPAQETS